MPVILGVASYPILPADNGRRNAITGLYDAVGKDCEAHIITPPGNSANTSYSFHLHQALGSSVLRYLPARTATRIDDIARKVKATHLICEDVYLSPATYRVSWEYGIPWYLRVYGVERDRLRRSKKWWLSAPSLFERHWMHKANGVFFITEEDRDWCIKHYKLSISRCHLAPFGVKHSSVPEEKDRPRQWIAAEHDVNPAMPWLYFIGKLNSGSNADAVRHIIHDVAPRLEASGKPLKILIGGRGLPDEIENEIAALGSNTIHYLGFIENLEAFLKGCDIMLNPILSGGGMNTRVIEALGYNKIVVSTVTGTEGILREVSGDNLLISEDGDWDAFSQLVLQVLGRNPHIPEAFFDKYYWGNIAKNLLDVISRDSF